MPVSSPAVGRLCAGRLFARRRSVEARAPNAKEAELSPQPDGYRDGHARPRALAFNWDDGLLYVALSTADQVAVVDPSSSPPRLLTKIDACRFPDAIAALPKGGALVGCRFDPGLVRITGDAARGFRASRLAGGLPAGARGLVVTRDGKTAYVASPPLRGIAVVALDDGRVLQTVPTGISPRALRLVPKYSWPGRQGPLLVVSNFIDHTVTVHPIGEDGRVAAAVQTDPDRGAGARSRASPAASCRCSGSSRTRIGRCRARAGRSRGSTAASSGWRRGAISRAGVWSTIPGLGAVRS